MDAPAVPPRKRPPTKMSSTDSSAGLVSPTGVPDILTTDMNAQSLDEADWYWGEITREEVNERLRDTPDGTFLIRDATNKVKGEYTLTVRKGGTNKLVKIFHHNGKYGFVETQMDFNSVVELVNYYKLESLGKHNKSLDVKLKYAVSRVPRVDEVSADYNVDSVKQTLLEHHGEFRRLTQQYDKLYDEHSRVTQEIQLKNQALEAFKETVKVFEDQISLHENFQKKAAQHEIMKLKENFDVLKSRLTEILDSKMRLEEDLKQQTMSNRSRIANMNSLKPEIKRVYMLREQWRKWLIDRNVSSQSIDKILEQEEEGNIYSQEKAPPQLVVESLLPHKDKSTWYIKCNRADSERYLQGKPEGTFLIRPKDDGAYALSIVANNTIGHCLIRHMETGYGFAEPYYIHETLPDLVLHYEQVSLNEHND